MSAITKIKTPRVKNQVEVIDKTKNYCFHLNPLIGYGFQVVVIYEGGEGYFVAVNNNGKGINFDNEEKGKKFVDAQNQLLGKSKIDCAKIVCASMFL